MPPAKHPVDFEAVLRLLNEHRVEYVVVGGLIEVKRAAGRPKDLEAIAELEALKEERDRRRI